MKVKEVSRIKKGSRMSRGKNHRVCDRGCDARPRIVLGTERFVRTVAGDRRSLRNGAAAYHPRESSGDRTSWSSADFRNSLSRR